MGNTLAVKGPTNRTREGRQGLGITIHVTFSFLGEYDRDQLPEEDPDTIVNRFSGN